jgi:hypothetical protein
MAVASLPLVKLHWPLLTAFSRVPSTAIRSRPIKARRRKIKVVNEGLNKPNHVIWANIIVYACRQKKRLRAGGSLDVFHPKEYHFRRCEGILNQVKLVIIGCISKERGVFTQSG